MKKTIWTVIVIVVVALIAWGVGSSGGNKESGPIRIGFIGPLTGDAANIGQNAKAAVELGVADVNASGGIAGRPLEVIYEDGKCNGTAATNAAQKLINIDKVPLIIGGACSGETSAFAGLAEQTKTVVLSYCSSAPALTNAGDYIFRDYPSDSFQGVFGAQYLYSTLGKKKVGVIYVKSDWGVGIKDVFSAEFKRLGGTVVAEEGYDQTSRDLRGQLTKANAGRPEVIYFLGYSDASIPALKQAKELNIKVPFFGGDAWDDSKIWTEVGKAGEGASYSIPAASPSDAFKADMKAKVGSDEIAVCTPTAFDAIYIAAQVLKKAGVSSDAIKQELYSTVYTGGVSSNKIQFDSNGDLIGASYVVKVVKDGKAVPLAN